MSDFPPLEGIVPEYHSRNPVINSFFRKRLDVALEFAELGGGTALDVLDLGCGEGLFLRGAAARFPAHRYEGWDIHPRVESVSVPGARFRRVDILAPAQVPPQRFDRILCLDVLEHFEDLGPVLAAVRGLFKPGGRLVISAPTETFLYRFARLLAKGTFSSREGPAAGPHYHDAAGLHRRFEASGLRRTRLQTIPPWPVDMFHISLYDLSGGG